MLYFANGYLTVLFDGFASVFHLDITTCTWIMKKEEGEREGVFVVCTEDPSLSVFLGNINVIHLVAH